MKFDLSNEVEDTDDVLVAQAQAGSRSAFSELVRRHQGVVYRVCYRILGSPEDAEDATQEAFLRAYKRLQRFGGRSSFKTWLLRLAVNVSLNVRERRRDTTPLDGLVLKDETNVEAAVMHSEAVARLHHALQHLPPNHRVAVVLRDLEGLSYRELADMLDVPEGTVRIWAYRGRKRLKELLT